MTETELASVSIANAPGIGEEDDSVFRSGGQMKEYPPRPRIATARPGTAEERRAPEQSQPPEPPEQSQPPEQSSN
jgi:hypothetical protein